MTTLKVYDGSQWVTIGGVGAPTDADYWVETANGSLSGEVVVGTTGITTAAYGSRQAAAKAGRLFLPNNGFYIERDTGSAWAPWGPVFPMTPPVSGDFAWINQGSTTIDTTNGGIYIETPATSGTNIRLRKKSAPATPYTVTVALIPNLYPANYSNCGIGWRQSSDGKMVMFRLVSDSANVSSLVVAKLTDATTFSANYVAFEHRHMWGPVVWLRIADNGTNRICSISGDGQHFIALHSVGRTDFLTGDEIGFMVEANQTSGPAGMTLLSWKES